MTNGIQGFKRVRVAMIVATGAAIATVVAEGLSAEPLEWQRVDTGVFREDFNAVVHGGDRFVAAGRNSQVAVSADGRHWTAGELPEPADLEEIVWSGERFLALSSVGDAFVSRDGLVWEHLSRRGIFPVRAEWAWNEALVVAVGRLGTLGVLTTPNGVDWDFLSPDIFPRAVADIVWAGDRVVGVGQNEYGGPDDLFATIRGADGGWEVVELGVFGRLAAFGWNGSDLLAILDVEEGLAAARSQDGLSWDIDPIETELPGLPVQWSARLHWIAGQWTFPAAEDGQGVLWHSSDGVQWQRQVLSGPGVNAIAQSATAAVAVGNEGSFFFGLCKVHLDPSSSYQLLASGLPGSLAIEPQLESYEYNDVVAITVDSPEGYEFDGWVGDASGSETTVTVRMDSSKAIAARFRLPGATEGYIRWLYSLRKDGQQEVAPMSDYNADGVKNLVKYVSGGTVESDCSPQPGSIVRTPNPGLQYRVSLLADRSIQYRVEYSDDLKNWTQAELRFEGDVESWIFHDPSSRVSGDVAVRPDAVWEFIDLVITADEGALPRFFRTRLSLAASGAGV